MRPLLVPLLVCIALPACGDTGRPVPGATAQAGAAPAPAPAREAPVPSDTSETEIRYVMVRDPQTRALLPRLEDTATAAARRVNRQLDSASAGLTCGPMPAGTEHWFESEARVDYAADGVFSMFLRASYYCDSPSPTNAANFSATFDLRRGKIVEFRDLFADWERDGRAIVRAMYPVHTEKARRLAAAGIEPANDSPDQCFPLYVEEALADHYFSYTFTDSGLVADPNFPQVIQSCAELAVVPYERLRPFAAPGGILLRVADAQRARRGR